MVLQGRYSTAELRNEKLEQTHEWKVLIGVQNYKFYESSSVTGV